MALHLGLNPFFIRSAVWKVGMVLECHVTQRLNPFFIRSAVWKAAAQRAGHQPFVSIPSSSGLLFGTKLAARKDPRISLNPFFIRSAVWNQAAAKAAGLEGSQSLLHQVCCLERSLRVLSVLDERLNPFFIRSAVWNARRARYVHVPRSQSLLHQVCCLEDIQCPVSAKQAVSIPSSSGLLFGRRRGRTSASTRCLNPFFIRSAVWKTAGCRTRTGGRVSIPSSSGLLFGTHTDLVPSDACRLNPFFIRSAVWKERIDRKRSGGRVSIPSSSGLLFGIRRSSRGAQ